MKILVALSLLLTCTITLSREITKEDVQLLNHYSKTINQRKSQLQNEFMNHFRKDLMKNLSNVEQYSQSFSSEYVRNNKTLNDLKALDLRNNNIATQMKQKLEVINNSNSHKTKLHGELLRIQKLLSEKKERLLEKKDHLTMVKKQLDRNKKEYEQEIINNKNKMKSYTENLLMIKKDSDHNIAEAHRLQNKAKNTSHRAEKTRLMRSAQHHANKAKSINDYFYHIEKMATAIFTHKERSLEGLVNRINSSAKYLEIETNITFPAMRKEYDNTYISHSKANQEYNIATNSIANIINLNKSTFKKYEGYKSVRSLLLLKLIEEDSIGIGKITASSDLLSTKYGTSPYSLFYLLNKLIGNSTPLSKDLTDSIIRLFPKEANINDQTYNSIKELINTISKRSSLKEMLINQ